MLEQHTPITFLLASHSLGIRGALTVELLDLSLCLAENLMTCLVTPLRERYAHTPTLSRA